MRKQILALTKTRLFAGFVTLLNQFDSDAPNVLRVLTYHRVDYPEASSHLSPALLSATPEAFAEQMRFLKQYYQPISIQQVLDFYNERKALPKRAIMVTVDDAYCDFESYIFPIAQQHEIPLSLFVPTDYPDHPERSLWWDKLYHALQKSPESRLESDYGSYSLATEKERMKAFKALRELIKSLPHQEAMALVEKLSERLGVVPLPNQILSWERLIQLAQGGVTLLPHTASHPMLNRLGTEEIRQEIRQSRAVLQEKLGAVLPVFAYPSGGVSEEVIELLRQEGFQLAFSTERGLNQLEKANPLNLKRINVGQATNLNLLRLQFLARFSKF